MPATKIVCLGPAQAGKTEFRRRTETTPTYKFNDTYKATIGTDFSAIDLPGDLPSKKTRILLWDFAGHERFRTLSNAFIRGAAAVIFFVNPDLENFDKEMKEWNDMATEDAPGALKFVVCTKMDTMTMDGANANHHTELDNRLEALRENIGAQQVFKYSSKTNELQYTSDMGETIKTKGTDPIFETIVADLVKRDTLQPEDKALPPSAQTPNHRPSYYQLIAKYQPSIPDNAENVKLAKFNQILAILNDYVQPTRTTRWYTAPLSLGLTYFFNRPARVISGHWNRHHVELVKKLIAISKTLLPNPSALEDINWQISLIQDPSKDASLAQSFYQSPKLKKNGSLARRLDFIRDVILKDIASSPAIPTSPPPVSLPPEQQSSDIPDDKAEGIQLSPS